MSDDLAIQITTELTKMRAALAKIQASQATLLRQQGRRLTRGQVCARISVHRNTLAAMIKDKRFPQSLPDGHWLEATVIEWEAEQEKA